MSEARDFAENLSRAQADKIREMEEKKRAGELEILNDLKEALYNYYQDNDISFEVTGPWKDARGVRQGINIAVDGFTYSISVVRRD